MAPSPRKPGVPRLGSSGSPTSSPSTAEDHGGTSFDDPPLVAGGSEDPGGSRISLGRSAKVTVLHPVDASDAGTRDAEVGDAVDGSDDRPSRAARRPAPVLAFPVPRAKRVRRRAILAVVSIVAVVAAVMALAVFSPVLAVRTITVEGTKMLAPAQVQAALAPLRGRPLPLVTPSDVSRLVAPIVQVKSVESRAVPPNTLLVTVVERVPVALVKQTDGYSVVDGDGVQIATAKDPSAYPVPVIDPQGAHMSHDTFLAVTGVLSALPADVLGQLATASAESVDSVQLKLSNGQTVVWGNAQDRDLKAKVLQALMKSAQNPAQGQAPVNVFDVSTPWHPVTR